MFNLRFLLIVALKMIRAHGAGECCRFEAYTGICSAHPISWYQDCSYDYMPKPLVVEMTSTEFHTERESETGYSREWGLEYTGWHTYSGGWKYCNGIGGGMYLCRNDCWFKDYGCGCGQPGRDLDGNCVDWETIKPFALEYCNRAWQFSWGDRYHWNYSGEWRNFPECFSITGDGSDYGSCSTMDEAKVCLMYYEEFGRYKTKDDYHSLDKRGNIETHDTPYTLYKASLMPKPTPKPTSVPTDMPTPSPTDGPTALPSQAPTPSPTDGPTASPTDVPTAFPTNVPTAFPTNGPTASPTNVPTAFPTNGPTASPTNGPTTSPTNGPTASPTNGPTASPTSDPTATPSRPPTSGEDGEGSHCFDLKRGPCRRDTACFWATIEPLEEVGGVHNPFETTQTLCIPGSCDFYQQRDQCEKQGCVWRNIQGQTSCTAEGESETVACAEQQAKLQCRQAGCKWSNKKKECNEK